MVQTKAAFKYFNPIVYSLDTLLPIIDLHLESYWEPKRGDGWLSPACVVGWYLRLHIVLGWLLTTVGVFAGTGIVRKGGPRVPARNP